jgi:hypothetical protein
MPLGWMAGSNQAIKRYSMNINPYRIDLENGELKSLGSAQHFLQGNAPNELPPRAQSLQAPLARS